MQLSSLSLALTAVYGPTALTISQLLPSGSNRVGAIYSDPARPSYDECIQKNMAAIAAGRPQDCLLFSDAAGLTPVVYPIGAGQGKGLLLDRSAGLVRGVELVTNGGFDTDTAWTKGDGWAIGSGIATKTAGTQSELSQLIFVDNVAGRSAGKMFEISLTAQVTEGGFSVSVGGYDFSPTNTTSGAKRFFLLAGDPRSNGTLYIRGNATFAGTIDNISVRELPGHHQQQPTAAARGEFSRRYNQLLDTATLATQSITAIATQYRLYFTGAGTVTLSGAATGTYSAGSHTITCTAGSLTLTVAGEVLTGDLRFEADATIGLPEYQRVTTASDYDETGFPTYWRAVTDDWAKSHMNPNGATKSYVFWAGQKMSDAATGVAVESSSNSDSVDGAMRITAPAGTVNTTAYQFRSKGSTGSSGVNSELHPAPHRAAVIGHGDITNDISRITVNGTVTTYPGDQGTGTYTEQDVFFGARAGTKFFANIREYAPPLILYLQPTDSLSPSHLAKLQKGYAKAVGVTL